MALTAVSPTSANNNASATITIEGSNFVPDATFDIDDSDASVVRDTFEVRLGDNALQDVEWVDLSTLRAVVPAGITAGVYDLTVTGPLGDTATLEAAFEVTIPDFCAGVSCGIHGTCVPTGTAASCVCDTGWTGDACDTCDTGFVLVGDQCQVPGVCEPDSCTGNGTCDDTTGAVVCTCDAGYAGATCADCDAGYVAIGGSCVVEVTCEPTSCNSHGTCDDSTNAIVCTCDAGWAGEFCDSCDAGYVQTGDDCVLASTCQADSCNMHGTCDDTTGSIVCTCDTGYVGPTCAECGNGFVDFNDECVLNPGDPEAPTSVTLQDPTPVGAQVVDTWTNDPDVTLVVDQPSPAAGYCVRVDTVPAPAPDDPCWATDLPATVALAGEGAHTVTVWTKNAVDVVSTTGTEGSITLDQTAPTLAFVAPTDGSTVSEASVAASGTVDDANGLLSFSVDGACAAPDCTFGGGTWLYDPLPLPAVGANQLAVEAVDVAGNTSTLNHTIVRDFDTIPTIDSGAPGIPLPTPAASLGVLSIGFGEFGDATGDTTTSDAATDLLIGMWGSNANGVEAWLKVDSTFAAADFTATAPLAASGFTTRSVSVAPWTDGELSSAVVLTNQQAADRFFQRLPSGWTDIAADTVYPDDNALLAGAVDDLSFAYAFIDYDLDGDLDVYRQSGTDNASFLEDILLTQIGVTPEGVWQYDQIGTGPAAALHSGLEARGLAIVDFDLDGRDDIFNATRTATLFLNGTTVADTPNFGIFPDNASPFDFNASDAFGTTTVLQAPTAFDYDNDGDLDLYVTAWDFFVSRLYRNELSESGSFDFTDVTTAALALTGTRNTTAAYAADIDNDGDLDIYTTSDSSSVASGGSRFLRNDYVQAGVTGTAGVFTDITTSELEMFEYATYGAAFVDHDSDGDLDLIVAAGQTGPSPGLRLFRNAYYENGGTGRHYRVKVRVGGQVNPLGTKVVVDFGTHTQIQQYQPVVGFGCTQPPELHFGVGDETAVDVRIYLPGATTPSLTLNSVATSNDGTVEVIDL